MRSTSQLTKDLLRVFKIVLRYFNGAAILTSFVLSSVEFFSVILVLDLNYSEFTVLAASSSL